jgi:hypothetical protein
MPSLLTDLSPLLDYTSVGQLLTRVGTFVGQYTVPVNPSTTEFAKTQKTIKIL